MSWEKLNNSLIKTYTFNSFVEVIDFVNKITPACEKLNHHPNFYVFDYRHIKFELTTHDENGLSSKDYELADLIDSLYIK